jgi:Na+-translocating ferredoxin:NAD+ oxidoreductase subunit G
MAKLESTLKNMILSLTLISMGMSGALGFVYMKTKGPIATAEKEKKEAAIRQVIPAFDSVSAIRVGIASGDTLIVTQGFKNGQLTGTAIETFSKKGFSGLVQFVVGILPDGTINTFGGFNHKETPGLGTKMADPKFKNQFIGKTPDSFKLKVKKDGGDVDAISAATISSRAFCDAVQKAYQVLPKENKK